jgi:hypothetical protein
VIFVISTTEPGRCEKVWVENDEINAAFEGFVALTGVWRYVNSFDPRTQW